VQPSAGNHCVDVRVELQFSVEGVEDSDDANTHTMSAHHMGLNDRGG